MEGCQAVKLSAGTLPSNFIFAISSASFDILFRLPSNLKNLEITHTKYASCVMNVIPYLYCFSFSERWVFCWFCRNFCIRNEFWGEKWGCLLLAAQGTNQSDPSFWHALECPVSQCPGTAYRSFARSALFPNPADFHYLTLSWFLLGQVS